MLFNDTICEHFTNPRNVGELPGHNRVVKIGNPVCGDTIVLHALVLANRVEDLRFLAYGCATSIATASIISSFMKGRTLQELASLKRGEVAAMLGELDPPQQHCVDIGMELIERLVLGREVGQVEGDLFGQ